jgi:hypothetical protein
MPIFLHLATNMLCLVLWGGHLEKRIGSFYFAVVYLAALIGGGIVSDLTHSGAYLTVGASGAVSGILGALLCLWLLGRVDLAANFFVVNIGLNVVLALSFSRIDWSGHLGGFAAGLISCAVLDLLEKVIAHIFRCKFPEFVKMNGLIVLGAPMVYFVGSKAISPPLGAEAWVLLAACTMACFALVKALDLLLSMKKGLAAVVIMFSAANALLVPIALSAFRPALSATCAAYRLRGAAGRRIARGSLHQYDAGRRHCYSARLCHDDSRLLAGASARDQGRRFCRRWTACRASAPPGYLKPVGCSSYELCGIGTSCIFIAIETEV